MLLCAGKFQEDFLTSEDTFLVRLAQKLEAGLVAIELRGFGKSKLGV